MGAKLRNIVIFHDFFENFENLGFETPRCRKSLANGVWVRLGCVRRAGGRLRPLWAPKGSKIDPDLENDSVTGAGSISRMCMGEGAFEDQVRAVEV